MSAARLADPDQRAQQALRRALGAHLADCHGLRVRLGEALPTHRHTITRHRIVVVPLPGEIVGGRVRAPLLWSALTPELPVTTSARRILASAGHAGS